uniref:Uncharacterized protein n=1 Tax=Cacopsylla melanoneura TaxID=428564 RepID=A0A8D8U373_9HEMI
MYRPSRTPRLARSSNRITLGDKLADTDGRRRRHPKATTTPPGRRPACAWFKNSVIGVAKPTDASNDEARPEPSSRSSRPADSVTTRVPLHRVSKETMRVVVFHRRRARDADR